MWMASNHVCYMKVWVMSHCMAEFLSVCCSCSLPTQWSRHESSLIDVIKCAVSQSPISRSPDTPLSWSPLPTGYIPSTLHVLVGQATSSNLPLFPANLLIESSDICHLHCTFCERQSHHIVFYDQQQVSDSIMMILWKAVPSHLFLWPPVCEWYCTFCERQSHHIFSYDQQGVSDIAQSVKSGLISMTNSLWVTLHNLWKAVSTSFFYGQQVVSDTAHFVKDSLIFSYDQQKVSDIAQLWKGVSSQFFLWPTASGWCCTFCDRQSHDIFFYDP